MTQPADAAAAPQGSFTAYRMLTGPDDAAFCRRVTEALLAGWRLHGPASLAYDAALGRVICGQAIVKTVAGPYDPERKLSEL
jgi:hypothetical protein